MKEAAVSISPSLLSKPRRRTHSRPAPPRVLARDPAIQAAAAAAASSLFPKELYSSVRPSRGGPAPLVSILPPDPVG